MALKLCQCCRINLESMKAWRKLVVPALGLRTSSRTKTSTKVSHSFTPIQTNKHLFGAPSRRGLTTSVESESWQLKKVPYIHASDEATLEILCKDMVVHEDFVTEAEEESILAEIEPYLKRMHYEKDHWDDAIHSYRETERKHWTEKNKLIIQRVRDLAFPPGVRQLAFVHILDLEKTGYIKPHVDAVRFCGDTIAGISLLSTAVMRLVRENDKSQFGDCLLKRRSLYIMKGDARYKFTHEVLPDEKSYFLGEKIPRGRRISIMCRNDTGT